MSHELFLYDEIGPSDWGLIDDKTVIAELANHKTDDIVVRVNSPGGDVFLGLSIYNALRRHPRRVDVEIDGLAASIASVICMAGKKVTIAASGMMMVHKAWLFALGNSDELTEMAAVLKKIDDQLAGIYVDKTGMSRKEVLDLMAVETWMTSTEAISHGFADVVASYSTQQSAKVAAGRYRRTPAALIEPYPRIAAATRRRKQLQGAR